MAHTLTSFIKSAIPPVVVVVALGWLSTVEVEMPEVFVKEQIIELRDRFYDVAIPDDKTIWAVGKNGKIVRSDDQGGTFVVQQTPTIVHLQSIAAIDALTAVVVGNDGTTLNTKDGGKNWHSVAAPLGDIGNKIFRVETSPEGVLWATAEFGSVLFSDDIGSSWTRVGGDADVAWNDVAFAGSRVCITGEFGGLRCSDDQGVSWQEKDSQVDTSMMAIAFRDQQHGLAVGLDGKVIRSNDGGETWELIDCPTSKQLYGLSWTGDEWAIVGEKGTLLLYDPNGDIWVQENLGPFGNIWHTAVTPGHGGLYLSGQKLGLWKDGALTQFGRFR